MRRELFPSVRGCDWAIRVRHVKRVPLAEDYEDLVVVRDALEGWVAPARTSFFDGGPFIALAGSFEEAVRLEQAAAKLIGEQSLYVIVSLVRRDASGRWEEVEPTGAPASDEEIEEELRAFADAGDLDDPWSAS